MLLFLILASSLFLSFSWATHVHPTGTHVGRSRVTHTHTLHTYASHVHKGNSHSHSHSHIGSHSYGHSHSTSRSRSEAGLTTRTNIGHPSKHNPSPQCSAVPKQRVPRGLHCGTLGSLLRPSIIQPNHPPQIKRGLPGFEGKTFERCRDSCLYNSLRISFSFDRINKQCTMYSKSVDSQGFRKADGHVAFYNRRCWTIECHSTTSSISSETAKTSSTTLCPLPTVCSNEGLQWAMYTNVDLPCEGGAGGSTFYTFNPDNYATASPLYEGVTSSVGFDYYGDDTTPTSFYGSTETFPRNNLVFNHRGYVYAQLTGEYMLNVNGSDDLVMVWFGQSAYSGWTRENAVLATTHYENGAAVALSMAADSYYPLRILYAQSYGAIEFNVQIVDPNGNTILAMNTQPTAEIVQFGCQPSGAKYPPFPPFGSEF